MGRKGAVVVDESGEDDLALDTSTDYSLTEDEFPELDCSDFGDLYNVIRTEQY